MSHLPDDFTAAELSHIEAATQTIGRHLLAHSHQQRPWILQRRWWDDHIMAWVTDNQNVKTQLFRFIDVLPMLRDGPTVTRHLQEYLAEVEDELPAPLKMVLTAGEPDSLSGRGIAMAARKHAQGYARRFIAGTNTAEVLAAVMRERRYQRAFTLDVLGEAVISESEADQYLAQYVELIEALAPVANAWREVPLIDCALGRPIPRVNVSVKLSALDPGFDPIDPVGTLERVGSRLRPLLRTAQRHGAQVHVDMESYRVKDLTLSIFQQILGEEEFRSLADVGIVIQCYLRDAERDIVALHEWATARGTPITVRLVKGAYWDYETIHAQAAGWPVPVFQQKWQSDACFERVTRYVMRRADVLHPAIASHNIRSLAQAIATARQLKLPESAYEIQMLYGMADSEKQALVDLGQRLRVYMPYGELIPGMAYLVRRLLENTSNDSFLKTHASEQVSAEELLMNPEKKTRPTSAAAGPQPTESEPGGAATPDAATALSPAIVIHVPRLPAFHNQPLADFAGDEDRASLAHAIEAVPSEFDEHYPLIIGGQPVETAEHLVVRNPSRKSQTLGTVALATANDAAKAVAAARAALPDWHGVGLEARAHFLDRMADELAHRRWSLAAWQSYECGKTWREADADVCEAIDFCRYYALQARALFAESEVDVPGEQNRRVYRPRGVAAIIAPWNFPLAILTGMTAAALVTGNTLVIKPAEQASLTAAHLMQILQDLHLPAGVVNYLPGRGEVAGAALVEHPDVSLIAFTGSRSVGLGINRRAAEISAQRSRQVKRVIAEMGGKNAIIIDDDADLDEAVIGVMQSAFGHQGQKCSACSRAIVLDGIYEAFVARLIEATKTLRLGPATDPASHLGPVIDAEALANIQRYIEIGKTEATLALAVSPAALVEQGYFVGPHIFTGVSSEDRLAQEEIFGPVLAVMRAANFDEALALANATDYALTGGIFSRSPEHLERARHEMEVGNLYLNRGITGALVGRQPFGGYRMSGIGSQAGGPDYLLQFVIPRNLTENTLRRGFAPPSNTDG